MIAMRRSLQATFHLVVTVLCVIITYSRYELILLDQEQQNDTGNARKAKLKDNLQHSFIPEEDLSPFNVKHRSGKLLV